jgi:hypothetical protein
MCGSESARQGRGPAGADIRPQIYGVAPWPSPPDSPYILATSFVVRYCYHKIGSVYAVRSCYGAFARIWTCDKLCCGRSRKILQPDNKGLARSPITVWAMTPAVEGVRFLHCWTRASNRRDPHSRSIAADIEGISISERDQRFGDITRMVSSCAAERHSTYTRPSSHILPGAWGSAATETLTDVGQDAPTC